MNRQEALKKAQEIANKTQCSTVAYENLIRPGEFDVYFTLPMFGRQISERIYPEESEIQ
jgi:hypothetical protein